MLELAERGHAVTVLARSPGRAASLVARGCRLVEGDLEDARAREALLAGADVVFHVAGVVAARSAGEFLRVNRDATSALALAAAQAGVSRFVLVSSLAVTGPAARGRLLDESSGPGPVTAYGRSKQAGEQAVREARVPFTIVRPPAVYGPGDHAFLTLFRLAARGVVPLLGDGRQQLTLVFAKDLARALVAAATSPATLGGTYHAGHPEMVTQRELAEATGRAVGRQVRCVRLPDNLVRVLLGVAGPLARTLGQAPLLDADKAHELLAPAWTASSEALRRDTGWVAEVPLERGLTETALAYREAGWL